MLADCTMQCPYCSDPNPSYYHNFPRQCQSCQHSSNCETMFNHHMTCPHCYDAYDHTPHHTSDAQCPECHHVAPCQTLLAQHRATHGTISEQTGGTRRRRASSPPSEQTGGKRRRTTVTGKFYRRRQTRGFRHLQRFVNYKYRPGGHPDFLRFLTELYPVLRKEATDYYVEHGALTYSFPIQVSSHPPFNHVMSMSLFFLGHIPATEW